MKSWIKGLLSLWIVFHLAVILVLPNGSSYLGRLWGNYLTPYANALSLNSTWNFFSPDPVHTMYLHYRVDYESKESTEGYLPPEKDQLVVDSSRRRFLYAMRFLLLDSTRFETLLGPYLCRQNPGASKISIRHVLETLPSLDKAVALRDVPISELKQESQSGNLEVDCEQLQYHEVAQ